MKRPGVVQGRGAITEFALQDDKAEPIDASRCPS
jgi:hypothetical protein